MLLRRTIAALSLLWAVLSPLAAIAQAPPAVAALPDQERRTAYSISGNTCVCAVNMALYGDGTDFDAWLQVWVNGARYLSTDPAFGWSLSTTTTGGFATGARPITNAILTFNSSITGTVQIVGARRPRQLSQFTENRGVAARDLNQRFTDVQAVERELWDKTNDLSGRGFFYAPGNVTGPMPSPAACAGKFLGFDGTGLNPQCQNLTSGTFTVPGTTVPGDIITWNNSSGGSLADSGVIIAPAGAFLELYASPTGSDTNNKCMNSGVPCTLQGACRTRSQIATYLTSSVTINVGPGTYSAVDGFHALCSIVGNFGGSSSALTNVTGDIVTPSNVIFSIPDNSKGVFTKDAGETNVQGIQFNGGNNSVGISGAQFSIADYGNVIWGTFGTNGIHINLSLNSSASLIAPETITAGAVAHWNVGSGANFAASSSTTFTGSPAWSTAFLLGTNPATINLSSWTFSGSTTGPRADLVGPGYLITPSNTPCASALPGNSGCTISLGFMDSADDAQTDGKLLNSAMPTPTRAGDILYWNGSAWVTVAGNNSGTQELSENSSGLPAWVTAAGTGTVTSAAVTASGGSVATGTCTITSAGSCNVAAPGGFLNVLRNNSMTAWFHGFGSLTITTAGGWCPEGVFVVPTGASAPCQQASTNAVGRPFNRMVITGATGLTDIKVRLPVDSYTASLLSGQTVTFQVAWFNNSGSTITPTLATKYPTAQDNWASSTADLAASNMQACTTGTACVAAYTLTVSNNSGSGYEFVVDFGNNFGSNASNMSIFTFDARVTPGVSTGANANPPPIEVRDRVSDIAWNQQFYQATYDNGVAPGTATHVGIIGTTGATSSNSGQMGNSFRTTMRCDPSVSFWDGAGNASKISFWNGAAWTDNQGVSPAVVSAGQNGFQFYNNVAGTNESFHYTADCTISGG